MDKDASAIRREIQLTRDRMGDTVDALGYKAAVPARIKDDVAQRVETVKGTISDVVDNVTATITAAGAVTADVSRNQLDALSQASDKVRDRVDALNSTIGDRVGQLKDTMNDRLQDADVPGSARRAAGAIQENPIGLALVALSIGFLTGSLLPVSKIERERLEPIGSKIVDQARAAATDLVEASKAVVLETGQSAVTSALNSAQAHGQEVVDAAKARAAQH
jgi:ElaB/YqjD/DUF883 family membrane-anchored ribosome-binding protein